MSISSPLCLSFCLLFTGSLSAAPIIRSVEGKIRHKAIVQIKGDGFGFKQPARPYIYADFEQSLDPSPLGRKKKWDGIENMEWAPGEGPNGGNGARAANGSGIWMMRADFNSWTDNGQKIYIFKHQRMNFVISDDSQNWKIWRMWPTRGTVPNLYMASSNGRIYVEYVGKESGFWGNRANTRFPTRDWYTEEIIAKASSVIGVKDGLLVLQINGKEKARGSILTRTFEGNNPMTRNYVVHGRAANKTTWSPPWSDSHRLWVDSVYADTTWARVLIGNQPSYVASTLWEIQIPETWSDDAISIRLNAGGFSKGREVYLYVFDQNGSYNTHGYPITLEQGDLSLPKRLSTSSLDMDEDGL